MEASQAQDMERDFFGHILPRYTRRQHKATPTMSPAVFRALRDKRAAAEAELTAVKLAAQRAQDAANPNDSDPAGMLLRLLWAGSVPRATETVSRLACASWCHGWRRFVRLGSGFRS
jgi:hypothetical protein